MQAVISSAVGGKPVTQIQEGEKASDLTVRWPLRLRGDEDAIRAVPVPVGGNTVTSGGTTFGGPGISTAVSGSSIPLPSPSGSLFNAAALWTQTPTRPLDFLISPLDGNGRPDPKGSFLRPGASTIYREQGQRLIAIKFEARGRDLASTVDDAHAKVEPHVKAPYRIGVASSSRWKKPKSEWPACSRCRWC